MARPADAAIRLTPLSGDELDKAVKLWDPLTGKKVPRFAELAETTALSYELLKNQNEAPLRSILSAVRVRYKAEALIEHPYYDFEFWHNHAGLYEWSFKRYDLACKRMHFFACRSNVENKTHRNVPIADWLSETCTCGLDWAEIQDQFLSKFNDEVVYVGYCILRPAQHWNVSRTAILFDTRSHENIPTGVPLHEVEALHDGPPELCVSSRCVAHMMNAKLEVDAPEFIQQDPHLGVCYTASLWVATRRIASHTLREPHYSYPTITRTATGTGEPGAAFDWDPGAGDTELSTSQIRKAVSHFGWHIFKRVKKEARPDTDRGDPSLDQEPARIQHLVYSALISKFPVLLCSQDVIDKTAHVVALVGTRQPFNICAKESCTISAAVSGEHMLHTLFGSCVKVYYAHDDAYGPYSRVVFGYTRQGDGTLAADETPSGPRFLLGRAPERTMLLRQVVIPIPPDVRNPIDQSLDAAIQAFGFGPGYDYLHQYTDYRAIWRSWLIQGAEFKRAMKERGYPPRFRQWYAGLHLPKYIWLHETTLARFGEMVANPFGKGRKIIAEYLYDATAPHYDELLLSERFEGHIRDYRDPGVWQTLCEDVTVAPFECRFVSSRSEHA